MKILFLSPFGGRTGSEMMLQYAIENAKESIEPIVFTRVKGSFFSEKFTDNNYFYPQKKSIFIDSLINGIYFKIYKKSLEQQLVEKINTETKPDLWYFNTITLSDHAKTTIKLGIPYVVHVHELLSSIDEQKFMDFDDMMRNAKLIICCSEIVEKTIQNMGYQQTVLIHECVDFSKIEIKKDAQTLRTELGIKKEDFVWAVSGTMSMRKGYDLIPEILSKLPKNHHIIWLGGQRDTALQKYVENRVKNENLNFHFLGEKSKDYYDYLSAADGFALLSREDPFPLVMIESAFLSKPIVAFDSGGVKEFVLEGMGKVTNGLNVNELCLNMIIIADQKMVLNPTISKNRANEFNAQLISKKWENVLKNLDFKTN